jgi:hypothetical protein
VQCKAVRGGVGNKTKKQMSIIERIQRGEVGGVQGGLPDRCSCVGKRGKGEKGIEKRLLCCLGTRYKNGGKRETIAQGGGSKKGGRGRGKWTESWTRCRGAESYFNVL